MKLNHEIFHKFFRAGETEWGRAKSNTSFYGRTFKSYNTTIGVKTVGKDGRPVLLIADCSFSHTTSEHIRALRSACPYTDDRIIPVPFEWGDCWYDNTRCMQALFQRFINKLSDYEWKVEELKYIKNRREFLDTYYNFLVFSVLLTTDRTKKAVLRVIEDLFVIAGEAEDCKKRNELISALIAKRSAREKRKAAE